MDTKTLCLGVLTFGEATGYELKKVTQDCFGQFLEVSYASIYPALADLHRQGLVDCEEVRQQGRPDKKVYRLTPAGHDALAVALAKSPGRHRIRSEFLALMFFADHLPPGHLQKIVDERLHEFDAFMEQAESLLEQQAALPPGVRFAAGYAEAVCRAAGEYIRANRGLLDNAEQSVKTAKGLP